MRRQAAEAILQHIVAAAVQVVHEYIVQDDLTSDSVSLLKDYLLELGLLNLPGFPVDAADLEEPE
jgi:hypothetical protein